MDALLIKNGKILTMGPQGTLENGQVLIRGGKIAAVGSSLDAPDAQVLNAQGGDWGICEISLFSGDQLMSQLRAQNHLYTVLEKGADGNQAIIVGAVHECLHAKLDALAAIIEKLCEP